VIVTVCAWCQAEGRRTVLRETPDPGADAVSHGICPDHLRAMRERLAVRTAGGGAMPIATTAGPMTVRAVLDALTYASYRANRARAPHIPPAAWARIYPDAAAMETRYRDELRGRLEALDEQIDEVWRDMGGQDPGVVPWPRWVAAALDRLEDTRAAVVAALGESPAREAAD
jgi:hypothetical protein